MSDTIKALTETVRGRVIIASDPDYDDARAVYNAMHDRRPHAVVQCTDSADVMAVIAAARDRGVDLAIRGGGHSVPGFGTVDDGLVIDLSPMKGVRVDPAKKVAWVGGGATWGMSTTRPTRSAWPRPAGSSPRPGWRASRWVAASATSPAAWGSPSTTCSRPMSFSPMAGRSRPATIRTRICSGHCAAAAATSVSSPASSSAPRGR